MPSTHPNPLAAIKTLIQRAEEAALAERAARDREDHKHLLVEVMALAHTDPHSAIPVRVLPRRALSEPGSARSNRR
jgi:hypothetical protein